MPQAIIRAAVVGASSLLGKELGERLNDAPGAQWDLKLLDKEDAAGQVTSAGDEAAVIQAVTPEAFTAQDIIFFAGDEASTREHWRDAVQAGAAVVDLTGALEGEENISLRAPLLPPIEANAGAGTGTGKPLDLSSLGVVSAHPAAIMLGAVVGKLARAFAPIQASATVLLPASQAGTAGMDEMHGQTVSLLSFKPLPQEVFDTQVAFNLSAELGRAAKTDLAATARLIRHQLELVAGPAVTRATAMQLVQAPVFNGLTASVFVATATPVKPDDIRRALSGDLIELPASDDPAPSNQSAAQGDAILIQLSHPAEQAPATPSAQPPQAESTTPAPAANGPQGFWLWIAADNLRLAARNAIACAAELLALRPTTKIQ